MTVQPDVIRGLATKHGFRGRGLLARFLYSHPISLVGYRANNALPVPDEVRQRWHRTIKDILKLPDPQPGEEHAILFSPEAHVVFQQYRDRVEAKLRPGAELYDIQDWGNKLAGNVARIAGVLHLFSSGAKARPWESPVTRATVERAIRLGEYFLEHANIAFAMMGADPRSEKGRQVWLAVQHLGFERFSLRELWQHVRRQLSVGELGDVVELLVKMNYLRPIPSQGPRGPGWVSAVFEVNPLARTQNPQNPQKLYRPGSF